MLQTTVIFEILDNLLVDINKESFRILQQSGAGGSVNVLDNVERYGIFVARSVPVEVELIDDMTRSFTGENLGMTKTTI